ncbi:hypothetical protein LZ023_38370 (plasmid) [Pseudomonas silvicola]|nr:hypothetical protein LZ023_38370 [Pseudomonas silvicola]
MSELDLNKLATLARDAGAVTIIDNSWASPISAAVAVWDRHRGALTGIEIHQRA